MGPFDLITFLGKTSLADMDLLSFFFLAEFGWAFKRGSRNIYRGDY